MSTHKAMIGTTEVEVSVHQRSPSVWVAKCTFLGIPFTAEAQTEMQAVSAVRAKANRETD